MVDLISCSTSDEFARTRTQLLSFFPEARIKPARAHKPKHSLVIECKIPQKTYILGLIGLNLTIHSFFFQMMADVCPDELISLIDDYESDST